MKTKFSVIACAAAFVLCAKAAHGADAASRLTLAQCLALASERSDELKIQNERRIQAEQRLGQARGALLPDVRFKYSALWRDTAGGVYDGDDTESRFALSQPLFSGFRRTEAVALAKADIEREKLGYRSVSRSLAAAVTSAFYAVVQAEADIANIREAYQLMQDRARELNERARLGKSRESEILAVESQMATLRAQQERSAGDRARTAELLARLLGVDAASLSLVDDAPAVTDVAPVERYREAAAHRSDVEAARQDVRIQESRVKIARGLLLPSVSLDGSWYAARGGSLASSDWDALVALDMPLFQGGIARSRINEERSRRTETEDRLSLVERDAVTAVNELYQALVSSLNQAKAYQDAFDKARKSYQYQLRDYRFGLVNNLEVLQAMTAMSDARRNLDRALVQVKNDAALLDIATK